MMIRIAIASFFFTLVASSVVAEQIVVPVGQQASYNKQLERPKMGELKSRIEQKYGVPISRTAAVGEPPISSWEYEKFTVYFEYDHVIHSVLKVDELLLD